MSTHMISTQQVQKILWYECHNNKDKAIVTLYVEKHLNLGSLISSTYFQVEIWKLNYPTPIKL
jgi:hypothetical protein